MDEQNQNKANPPTLTTTSQPLPSQSSPNIPPTASHVTVSTIQELPGSNPVPFNADEKSRRGLFIAVSVVVVLGLIAGGAYMLLIRKPEVSKDSVSSSTKVKESSPAQSTQPAPAVDETASWKAFTNTDIGYTLKYPTAWLIAGCLDEPPEKSFIVLLSNNPAYLGDCPATNNKPRQITVGYSRKSTANPDFPPSPIEKVTELTVGGVNAKKYVKSFENVESGGVAQFINYRFYTKGANFTVSYSVRKDPATGKLMDENLTDFTTMVEKTLKFN